MAIKGISGDIMSIINNQDNNDAVQSFIDSQASTFNTQSPLAAAQLRADLNSRTQQKKPVVFEYARTAANGIIEWATPIEMYINPNRISISTQKIKGKQITRGGIFYNMWGDDNWTMTIGGVTGLSGMKGIEQIEEFYHASGTLLSYQTFGPEKIDIQDAGGFQTVDYSDPQKVINAAVNANNVNRLDDIDKVINSKLSKIISASDLQKFNKALAVVRTLKNQFYTADISAKIVKLMNDIGNSADQILFGDSFVKLFDFNGHLKGLDPSIISQFVIELEKSFASQSDIIKSDISNQRDISNDLNSIREVRNFQLDLNDINNTSNINTQTQIPIDPDSITSRLARLTAKRAESLTEHLKNLKDFYTREATIRNNLISYANNTSNGDFADLWRPRRVICYFENRAYIGHFDTFNYNRDAASNMITYELRFTVERTLVSNAY